MDNIAAYDTFSKYFKKKGYNNLSFWFKKDSWENKYQLKKWLMKCGMTDYVATILAKDVFVVLTDAWHFFKAVGIAIILQPYVKIFAEYLQPYGINYLITYIITIILSGSVFNFLFYKFSNLK
jgi:hypothetical protein